MNNRINQLFSTKDIIRMYPNNLYRIKEFLKNKFLIKSLKVKKNIDFGNIRANNFFLSCLKNSNFYFEYGSGSSTLLATKLKKKFVSIESDYKFFRVMLNKIKTPSIKFVSIGPTLAFSYPLFIFKKKILDYINSIDYFFKKKKIPDLILIDGRFRVACSLNLLNFKREILSKKTIIILDDYKKRSHYRDLNFFFSIKEVGRMAILKPKNKKNFKQYFYKYLLDPR